MITLEQIKKGERKIKIKGVFVGTYGSGKTYAASTFPKAYFAFTSNGEENTIINNKELHKNVVGWDFFVPESKDDTKRVFEELDKKCIEAKELAKKGEIETFVLDNLTYLAENRWIYLNRYEPITSRDGALDTRGMYGALGRWLYEFVYTKILTIPCSVIVNVHEDMESDEQMAKKIDKSSPIVPAILGGFRDKIGGMVDFVLYLTKLEKGGKYEYWARTNLGNGRQAKSRFNLPATLQNFNYQTLMESIEQSLK